MFAIFIEKKFNQFFNLLIFDMWTVQFGGDSKTSLILCNFERHFVEIFVKI